MWKAASCGVLVLLSACATKPPAANPGSHPPQRYQAGATVLEAPGKQPMLCLGVVLESLPPQCGGPPITNWSWSAVADEQSANGTTWGEYHVIGIFDGEQFTLTDPPGLFRSSPPPANQFASPCEKPPGGWTVPDRSKADGESQTKAIDYARGQPDLAGVWLDGTVLNLKFTGDLQRHEREIRTLWGGALCVSKGERTLHQLRSTQNEVTRDAGSFDLQMLSAGVDEIAGVVTLDVVVVHPDTQQRLDDRFGKGMVRVTGRLQPVP